MGGGGDGDGGCRAVSLGGIVVWFYTGTGACRANYMETVWNIGE